MYKTNFKVKNRYDEVISAITDKMISYIYVLPLSDSLVYIFYLLSIFVSALYSYLYFPVVTFMAATTSFPHSNQYSFILLVFHSTSVQPLIPCLSLFLAAFHICNLDQRLITFHTSSSHQPA